MKKLVVMAAVLVAAASSYAECAPVETPEEGNCAQVYTVAISVKTTAPKTGSIDIGSECAPGSTSVCYRVISSKSFKGYYWTCDCGCDFFQYLKLDLFDKKTEQMIVEEGSIEWDLVGRIGKKNTDVEASFSFIGGTTNAPTAEFFGQGFGKFDEKNNRVSSISGSILGTLAAPYCSADCAPGLGFAMPYDLCDLTKLDVDTIAYGTFSIKYNSSASKKLAEDEDYIINMLPSAI